MEWKSKGKDEGGGMKDEAANAELVGKGGDDVLSIKYEVPRNEMKI